MFARVVELCDEILIKKMAISICGLNKRSFNFDDDNIVSIMFGLKFEKSSKTYIERGFQKQVTSFDEADLPPKKLNKKKSKGIYQVS